MQKDLVDTMVRRDLLRLKYNRLLFERAQQNVAEAETYVGRVRLAIRKSGHYVMLARCSDLLVSDSEGQFATYFRKLF